MQNILLIYHVPSFYNKLHLIDALFAQTWTSFGIGQTVNFSFINRNVSIKQILLTCFILFPISCLQTEGSSQRILHSANTVVHLAKCETQDLYYTDTSDMNELQSWSLPSLNLLSADLFWFDMYIWLSHLNSCLDIGETRYNLDNWCFWVLSILILLNKSIHVWLKMT